MSAQEFSGVKAASTVEGTRDGMEHEPLHGGYPPNPDARSPNSPHPSQKLVIRLVRADPAPSENVAFTVADGPVGSRTVQASPICFKCREGWKGSSRNNSYCYRPAVAHRPAIRCRDARTARTRMIETPSKERGAIAAIADLAQRGGTYHCWHLPSSPRSTRRRRPQEKNRVRSGRPIRLGPARRARPRAPLADLWAALR